MFHPGLEAVTQAGLLPQHIVINFEPLLEPLWIMIHNVPLVDQGTQFATVIYPGIQAHPVIMQGIIPLLHCVFDLRPELLPLCFRQWHSLVHAYGSH